MQRSVAVVGGGVVGCAIACRLSQGPFKVTLIERDAIAAHASGLNAGNLNPLHATPPELIPFALHSFHLLQKTAADILSIQSPHAVPVPTPRLFVGFSEADRHELEHTHQLFNSHPGFSAAWLNQAECHRLETRLSPEIRFGVLAHGNLTIDGRKFTNALVSAAAARGCGIRIGAVTGVESQGSRVTALRMGEARLPIDAVVFATGPWTWCLSDWLGLDISVTPIKGELLILRLCDGSLSCDITHNETALYSRGDGDVWLGGTKTNAGFNCTATPEVRHDLLERAGRLIRHIGEARVIGHTAALRPVTPGNKPLAKLATGWQNVYIANGAGFKGLLMSVGMAEMIYDLLNAESGDSREAGSPALR